MYNTNKTIGRKPDGLMQAGAIISIIVSSLAVLAGFISSMVAFFSTNFSLEVKIPGHRDISAKGSVAIGKGFAIFILIMSLLNIITIILNIYLLQGKFRSSVLTGVVTIILLLPSVIGIVGGVLVLVGKFKDQEKINNDNIANSNDQISK